MENCHTIILLSEFYAQEFNLKISEKKMSFWKVCLKYESCTQWTTFQVFNLKLSVLVDFLSTLVALLISF